MRNRIRCMVDFLINFTAATAIYFTKHFNQIYFLYCFINLTQIGEIYLTNQFIRIIYIFIYYRIPHFF